MVNVTNAFTYTRYSITIPANSIFMYKVTQIYYNSEPKGISVSSSSTDNSYWNRLACVEGTANNVCVCGRSTSSAETHYIWFKGGSSASNKLMIHGAYLN